MADEFSGQRLPDLPNAGYQTRTQRELSDAMMFLLRGFERDRLLLLETVIGGKLLWRKRFKDAYRAIKADDEMADAVFGYFQLLADEGRQGPAEAQKAILEAQERFEARQAWDKRQATAIQHAKDQRAIIEAVKRESRRPKRTYTH